MSYPNLRWRASGVLVRIVGLVLLVTASQGMAQRSGLAQEPNVPAAQSTSWDRISRWFSTDSWSNEGLPATHGSAGPLQISGLFDTPKYPPEDREGRIGADRTASASEPTYVDGIYAINKDYIYSWGENSWRVLTGPARYDRDDWINVAIVAGITGSLLLVDKAANDFWQDDVRGESLTDFFDTVTEFGDFKNIAYGTIGAYAAAEVLGAKREKAATLMILESVLMTTALTEGLKIVTGRERPKDAPDAFDFNGITGDSSHDSLPSGHASNAFAVASVISEVYGDDNPWVPWIAYPIAGGVGLSRINLEKHFLSDVFLGSAIGFFVGKMVTRYNPFLEESGIEVKPFGQQGAQGISVAYKF